MSLRFARSCLLASLFLAACGDGGGNYHWDSVDGGEGDLARGQNIGPDMAESAYPQGPYGNQIGQTLADLTLKGYRLTKQYTDSTKLQWDDISLHDYHANPRCKCLLITVGALWCGACQQEQPQLIMDVAADNNFCVLGVVQEGDAMGSMATKADLDFWTQHFNQDFFVAQGNQITNNYFNGYAMGGTIGLPFNLVVTPSNMKVVDSWQGFDPSGHDHAMASCGGM